MQYASDLGQLIYLDYNATTPVSEEVVAAMQPYWTTIYGNPSSSHRQGSLAHAAIEQARGQVARLVGVDPDWIVFTGGATEANNLALLGAAQMIPQSRHHLIISAVEHPAVAEPARQLERRGWTVSIAPVDETGRVKLAELEALLSDGTGLVSIMHANNETGTIQPIAAISRLTKAMGIVLHTDAAQSVGKVKVNMAELGADMLVIAGHKFYAPKGVGALVRDPSLAIAPIVYGAGHEGGLRPGTENLAFVVALGEAARLAVESLSHRSDYMRTMRNRLHQQLANLIPGLVLNGHDEHRLPNTLNVSLPSCLARHVLAQIAESVAASAGSACHSDADAVSGVLGAMGVSAERAAGAIRFSVGKETDANEIDRAAIAVAAAWESLRSK